MSLAEKKQKEEWRINYYRLFFWGSFVCLFFYMVFMCKNVVFAVHDDIVNYVAGYEATVKDKMMGEMISFRFRFRWDPISAISVVLNSLVAKSSNVLVYKLYLYVPIFACLVAIYLFLNKRVGKEFGSLFGIFFLLFVSLDNYHNVMMAYPFNFMMNLITFVVLLELLFRYYDTNKKRYIIISSIIFFFFVMSYESFLAFSLVVFGVIVSKNVKKEDGKTKIAWKHIILQTLPYAIAGVLYLVGYVLSQMIFKFSYEGTTISTQSSLKTIIKTHLFLGLANFPLHNFFNGKYYKDFSLSAVTIAMWLKAAIGTSAVFVICTKLGKISFKKGIYIIGVCCVSVGFFLMPFALNERQQQWVAKNAAYVPTSITYFWIVVVLVVIVAMLLSIKKARKPIIAVLCILAFCTSILTDYTNKQTLKPVENLSKKELQFQELVNSDYYQNLPENSVIYSLDYTGVHSQLVYLQSYAALFSKVPVAYTNEIDELANYENRYVLKYNGETEMIWMGKLGENYEEMRGDEIFAIPAVQNERGGGYIVEKSSPDSELIVNGVSYDYFPEVALVAVSISEPVLIEGDDMSYEDFTYSNGMWLRNSFLRPSA